MEVSQKQIDSLVEKLKYGLKAKELDICKEDIRTALEFIRQDFQETCSLCQQVIKEDQSGD